MPAACVMVVRSKAPSKCFLFNIMFTRTNMHRYSVFHLTLPIYNTRLINSQKLIIKRWTIIYSGELNKKSEWKTLSIFYRVRCKVTWNEEYIDFISLWNKFRYQFLDYLLLNPISTFPLFCSHLVERKKTKSWHLFHIWGSFDIDNKWFHNLSIVLQITIVTFSMYECFSITPFTQRPFRSITNNMLWYKSIISIWGH